MTEGGEIAMNCLEFRRAAGADPGHLDDAARAHRDACPACAEHHRGLLAMDETIRGALRVPLPSPSDATTRPTPLRSVPAPRQRWYALAASLLAGVIVGGILWSGGPRTALAREVVAHVEHEPQSLTATHAEPAAIERVLRAGGIRLRPEAGEVTYANSCAFRGQVVPHLVVRTAQGPVTVLVLRNEPITRPIRVREGGFQGSVLPAGPGSIAVIGEGPADLDEIKAQVLDAIEWLEP